MRIKCEVCGFEGRISGQEVRTRICPKCHAKSILINFMPECLGDDIMYFYGTDGRKIRMHPKTLSGYLLRKKEGRTIFPYTKEAAEASRNDSFIRFLFSCQKDESLSAKYVISSIKARLLQLDYDELCASNLAVQFAIGFHLIVPAEEPDILLEFPEEMIWPDEIEKAERLYEDGLNLVKRGKFKAAIKPLEECARLGYGPSFWMLGLLHEDDGNEEEGDPFCIEYYEAGAKLGDLNCLVKLGFFAFDGCYGDKGDSFALSCFKRGADKENPLALLGLGLLNDLGRIVECDEDEAKRLYLQSYGLGNLDAGYLYATILESSSLSKEQQEAKAIFSELSEKGYSYSKIREETSSKPKREDRRKQSLPEDSYYGIHYDLMARYGKDERDVLIKNPTHFMISICALVGICLPLFWHLLCFGNAGFAGYRLYLLPEIIGFSLGAILVGITLYMFIKSRIEDRGCLCLLYASLACICLGIGIEFLLRISVLEMEAARSLGIFLLGGAYLSMALISSGCAIDILASEKIKIPPMGLLIAFGIIGLLQAIFTYTFGVFDEPSPEEAFVLTFANDGLMMLDSYIFSSIASLALIVPISDLINTKIAKKRLEEEQFASNNEASDI